MLVSIFALFTYLNTKRKIAYVSSLGLGGCVGVWDCRLRFAFLVILTSIYRTLFNFSGRYNVLHCIKVSLSQSCFLNQIHTFKKMKKYHVGTLLSIAIELIQINAYVIYKKNLNLFKTKILQFWCMHAALCLDLLQTLMSSYTVFHIFMLVINHLAHIKNISAGLVLLEKWQLSSFLIAVCTCASDGLVNLVSHS